MELNEASMKLILDFEVGGGEAYYNRLLKSPIWPKGASGVTIGVGYDLGYNTATTIRRDWSPHLSAATVARLVTVAGKTGASARDALGSVRDLVVPWAAAFAVYRGVTIPKFWAMTRRAFPGVDGLHPNAQGALLSLIFNRGAAMSGPRRAEMRAIRGHVPAKDYAGIARQIRLMKRLWVGTEIERGMTRRREAEAALVGASV